MTSKSRSSSSDLVFRSVGAGVLLSPPASLPSRFAITIPPACGGVDDGGDGDDDDDDGDVRSLSVKPSHCPKSAIIGLHGRRGRVDLTANKQRKKGRTGGG